MTFDAVTVENYKFHEAASNGSNKDYWTFWVRFRVYGTNETVSVCGWRYWP
jgi:hypothetical protein